MAEDKITSENLSLAEKKVIYLMRRIRPYERIEIKLNENKPDELSVNTTGTTKEVFKR